ncbi:hypothetical protein AURDEDRAFT_116173 [Auricularia subglabra TFB-10046 SS5]|nr:hypothetical protein AURDEDRAFT_116173 [Auricularia subglabra TFB-10046 SS5]
MLAAGFLIAMTFWPNLMHGLAVVVVNDSPELTAAAEPSQRRTPERPEHTDVPEEDPQTMGVENARSPTIVIWAVAMFAVNVAVWTLTLIGPPVDGYIIRTCVNIVGVLSVFGPLQLLFHLLIRAMHTERDRTEMRKAMLNGIICVPVFALCLIFRYPERLVMAGDLAWLALSVYASQAVVWLHFFQKSKRDSLRLAAAREP